MYMYNVLFRPTSVKSFFWLLSFFLAPLDLQVLLSRGRLQAGDGPDAAIACIKNRCTCRGARYGPPLQCGPAAAGLACAFRHYSDPNRATSTARERVIPVLPRLAGPALKN